MILRIQRVEKVSMQSHQNVQPNSKPVKEINLDNTRAVFCFCFCFCFKQGERAVSICKKINHLEASMLRVLKWIICLVCLGKSLSITGET